jgi:predicted alpha/beta hydrolase family esterase
MRAADADLLLVPGTATVDPGHWMVRWTARLSTARVIAGGSPAALAEAVVTATRPVVLIAHGAGVAQIMALLAERRDISGFIAGVVLVAPHVQIETALAPLAVPGLLIASRSDPHCPYDAAERLAAAWQVPLADAGDSGSLDADSGHGPWPDGVLRLAGFLRGLGQPSLL